MTMSRFEKMGGTPMTPEQERTKGPLIGRSKSLGEMDELQKLFEELMGGETPDIGEMENFDWEGLWNSLMGEEETGKVGEEPSQTSRYPTTGGASNVPLKFNYY